LQDTTILSPNKDYNKCFILFNHFFKLNILLFVLDTINNEYLINYKLIMRQIYSALKELISPQMTMNASAVVDEPQSNVLSASNSIIASLLGVMLKNGDTPQIKNILDEAGNLNILAHAANICREEPTKEQRKIGDDFLEHLLGDKAADFSNPIAKKAGISKVAVNRLVSMIAPLVAGYLGNKLVKEKRTFSSLLQEIKDEKSLFGGEIPSTLLQSFGLGSAFNAASSSGKPVETKKKSNWAMWIILLGLLLLLLFWWRSCNKSGDTLYESDTVVLVDTVKAQPIAPTVAAVERISKELVLPNGVKLQAYEGGIEDKVIKYLQSDAYKNATENELKDKWFEFDNIDFEFNSGTQLMNDSKAQLNNLIAILKNFKDAKVRVAAFADKRGSEEVNMEISKERAKTIEKLFEEGGVGSQVVKVEGRGDEFATRSADAPDSERAKDRDIALRFTK